MRHIQIDLDLPENPTAAHCLRQQELVNMVHDWQNHDKDCTCRSCLWVREQLIIGGAQEAS